MMLLVIDDFDEFKVFFDVIYDITDLVELQVFRDHMICSILDKAHTRFMSVEYKSDFFSVYETDDVESVTLFAEDLHTIIKSARKIDSVTLQTNENYLVCKFESHNGNSRIFEFVLPAEHIESPNPPKLTLPTSFDLNLDDLRQGINDLSILGSGEIQLTVNNDILTITSGADIQSNYASTIPIQDTNESLSSKFSIDYIEQLLKFNKINKLIKIELGDNYPLLYEVEDDIMGVKVNGLIAPRLEVDE